MELPNDYDPINFNDPLELVEVFRLNTGPMIDGDVGPKTEYSGRCAVLWDDIRGIDQYFFPDDWLKYKGEKYYLILANKATPKLILGSYSEIVNYWKLLRRKYPIYTELLRNDDDDDDDE